MLSLAFVALLAAPDPDEAYLGILTARFENDWFVGSDNNYTSGVGLSWTTAALPVRAVEGLAWLPAIGSWERAYFHQFRFVAEMYTASDITNPDPPPGDHPYAGILALDLSVFSKGERDLQRWTVRLGMVGPSTGVGELQKSIHRLTGAPIPQGWDSQLSDEPLLNLFYQVHRRLFRRAPRHGWGFDAEANAGAGLGNYYIGANLGVEARVGWRLPDTYAFSQLVGADDSLVGASRRTFAYVFVGVSGYGTARFLPTDGNTFSDSPSGERDDFHAALSTGLVVGANRVLITFRVFFVRETDIFSPENDFAALTVSYLF